MSTRTWNAGFGQNLALFIMMLFWMLLILLAIIQTNWNWNFGTVVGLIFVICVSYGWVLFFMRSGSRSNLSKTRSFSVVHMIYLVNMIYHASVPLVSDSYFSLHRST
jgi:hypothetical protein